MSIDTTPTNERLEDLRKIAGAGVVLKDRWKLVRCIASGGYGDVWFAEDVKTADPYAIKILRHDAGNNDPGAIGRLRLEAEILEHLDHPNLVKVYGFFDSAYGQCLVMEYLDGLAIDQAIKSQGPADSKRVLKVVEQLLGALQVAHDHDILHRDIKPENIILARTKNGEIAKLVDFGIAKAQSSFGDAETGVTMVQTRAGGFMGTPRYAAPEQAVGDPMGPRSDLFALGLVITEWLTGTARLGGTHAEVMQQLLDSTPIRVSDCPPAWHFWLQRLLEKAPERRFQSAREAADGLEMVRSFDLTPLDLPPRPIPTAVMAPAQPYVAPMPSPIRTPAPMAATKRQSKRSAEWSWRDYLMVALLGVIGFVLAQIVWTLLSRSDLL